MRLSTMLRLNQGQRALLAEKLCDGGNLSAGALVLGQLVGTGPFSIPLAASGIALWLTMIGSALLLQRSERQS
jgi:hypothetical protein